MSESVVGTKVWVKSALQDGFFLQREIVEMESDFSGNIYYLSRDRLRDRYRENDLVNNIDLAKKLCQEALEKKSKNAKEKLDDFVKKYILQSLSAPAWDID